MTVTEFLVGHGLLLCAGVAFGVLIFVGMTWAWLNDELHDLFADHEDRRW